MSYCEFERVGERLVCRRCGWGYVSKAEPHKARRSCKVGGPVPPSFAVRVANFTKAAIAHQLAGNPTCTQEQIDERLAVCQTCELFRRDTKRPEIGICTHKDCGCNVSRENVYLNKLAWADQECPIGKWGAVG